ncbi:MAG TPA: UDP-N-acetylmuramoyl-L-alanine--D-glutamate ligase [Bacteroidota bacterium]
MSTPELRDTNIAVLGAARSGTAVARLLRSKGARVLVSDQRPAEQLREAASELASEGVDLETGGHSERVFDSTLMVLSPGVLSDAPVVREALRRAIHVVSEVEVASWFCRPPIVAVTGSNGKTTTTTLIGRILGDAKKKHVVAGNIGTAFSSVVLDLAEDETAVLEISSFQLDHCETFHPKISVLLNITEDHMDRYGHSMQRYASSKARVFMNQTHDDILVYYADDPWTAEVVRNARCRRLPISLDKVHQEGAWVENDSIVLRIGGNRTEIIPTGQMSMRGSHNVLNAMAAASVGYLAGVSPASIRATLRNFKGVEHRLEFVREIDGVRYYNDSKATNVDSVRYALQAFTDPVILFLGGRDKGNDYSRILDLVKQRAKAVIALGESAERVELSFRASLPVHRVSSMSEAVTVAAGLAKPGDVVLLSPACASFDWFENYEHRGRVFKELVYRL